MGQAKTHFETIPLETVKKIVHELPTDEATQDCTPTDGISPPEDWREIALRVQLERDPNKMLDLVQQLIETYDEKKLRRGRPVPGV